MHSPTRIWNPATALRLGVFAGVVWLVAAATPPAGLPGERPAPPPAADRKPAEAKSPAVAAKPIPAEVRFDVLLLRDYGIHCNAESLRRYLQSMLPNPNSAKRHQKLIEQLGDPNYRVREAAEKTLLRLPTVHADLLTEAVNGRDAEVRLRADRVLTTSQKRSVAVLLAAFSVIAHRKVPGLAEEVLATEALYDKYYVKNAAARALIQTARREDAALLKSRLAGDTSTLRFAAIEAYANVLKRDADDELRRLTRDDDDAIRVAAAQGMLSYGNRDGLPVLTALLESEDVDVRVSAVRVLRAASGKQFDFVAYEPSERRAAARGRWEQWLSTDGRTAELKLPLKLRHAELGRTIYCDYSANKVIQVDAKGTRIWEHGVGRHPWACQGLPNGNWLVANYSDRSVVEYDANRNPVWGKTELPGGPTSVDRLENGNTLVACTDSSKVLEINPRGAVVWSVEIPQRPTDAHRLPDGRTLIALQNGHRIVEVDREGKVRNQITGVSSPFSAYRLENGNTLVACTAGASGGVHEYDREGRKVWSYREGISYAYDAQRLANGNTLISTNIDLREVDRDGRIVWSKAASKVSKLHRY